MPRARVRNRLLSVAIRVRLLYQRVTGAMARKARDASTGSLRTCAGANVG